MSSEPCDGCCGSGRVEAGSDPHYTTIVACERCDGSGVEPDICRECHNEFTPDGQAYCPNCEPRVTMSAEEGDAMTVVSGRPAWRASKNLRGVA